MDFFFLISENENYKFDDICVEPLDLHLELIILSDTSRISWQQIIAEEWYTDLWPMKSNHFFFESKQKCV